MIFTKSPMVKKAREGVMEFLLINHPLDCPICDQGGECDLQDQAMAYGVDKTRFAENKRAVEDKYIGPLVKTVMNRCIHCTRCVRFTTEVAGVSELGAIGRGEDMEITTYLEQAMTSELQGNVIDLCPVGALTSQALRVPGAAVGADQDRVDRRDGRGRLGHPRRCPRPRGDAHHAAHQRRGERGVDLRQDPLRLGRPAAPSASTSPMCATTGACARRPGREAFAAIAAKVKAAKPERIGAIAGDLAAVEEMFALQGPDGAARLAEPRLPQDGAQLDPTLGRASYLFNATIAGIDEADGILIIGANPRREAPVLNARIRKRWLRGQCPRSA